ncbi:MAG: type II toxin-antitoxin system VapC family toxin [Nitrososphaerota archaeon]|nr:type II toxin-antitoxin system VapC family toxin [Nitrososphaerota archaeon]
MIFETSALIHTIRRKSYFEEGTISIITVIEALRGIKDAEKRENTLCLLEQAFEIVDVDLDVAHSYLTLHFELKRKGESCSDADEPIVATAFSEGETLLTADKGFQNLNH